MRKTILLMAFLAPLALGAQKPDTLVVSEAGFYLQHFIRADSAAKRLMFQGFEYDSSMRAGLYGFVYYEPKDSKNREEYMSGVGGYFYDFSKYFEVGVVVGGEVFHPEKGDNRIFGRYGGYILTGPPQLVLDAYYEGGPSKQDWYQATLNWQIASWLALGGIAQTSDGYGPRLRLTIPMRRYDGGYKAIDLRLWAAPMFSEDGRSILIGGELVIQAKDLVRPSP